MFKSINVGDPGGDQISGQGRHKNKETPDMFEGMEKYYERESHINKAQELDL